VYDADAQLADVAVVGTKLMEVARTAALAHEEVPLREPTNEPLAYEELMEEVEN
jgi:hypothetical protein